MAITTLVCVALTLFCSWTCVTATCPPTYYGSCRETYLALKCSGSTPKNGMYTLAINYENNRVLKSVYCNMEGTHCGSEKGWMRVSELDMTLPGSKCPAGLNEGTYGTKKLCGNRASGCLSTFFKTDGIPYTRVCGFVAGYQDKTPDAFHGKLALIDSTYLDGISITHGKPRKHIWSYAAGGRSDVSSGYDCPCNVGGVDDVPKFVGDDWYCESGNPTAHTIYKFFGNDVLWDGKKCTGKEPPCCKNPSLPYFNKNLGAPVNDDIELRVCHNEVFANEDVPIESYRFYVQ